MKFVALISGGKDSFFNIHHCLSRGHELVALANLYPINKEDEIDSHMFQTVGHDIIDNYGECLGKPLIRRGIVGKSSNLNLEYEITQDDEIEDLYELLKEIKQQYPEIEAVSCGAILSQYQRTRVENVCDRLGLTSLAYLWQRNQMELMQEMCQNKLDARMIKVAAIGLNENHLGKSITEMLPVMMRLNQLYDVHICGEGGEFETIVLDSPIFVKKLRVTRQELFKQGNDEVAYLKYEVEVVDKEMEYEDISMPPLLEEEFESMVESEGETEQRPAEVQLDVVKSNVYRTKDTLYVSNLVSEKKGIEEQATDIFQQLRNILEEHGIGMNQIQHVNLLLSNIEEFNKINLIYQRNFKEYLPPSRVCVQTVLYGDHAIQLSCIGIIRGDKLGIHIRSRSYWAPQNIGPYSQSIVVKRDNYEIASISGQIPLVPFDMSDCKDDPVGAALSLQHLHRVKNLVNVDELGYVICFITRESLMGNVQKAIESYSDNEMIRADKFFVVKVEKLPRDAKVEWGGLSYKEIESYEDNDEEEAPLIKIPEFESVYHTKIKQNNLIIIHTNQLSKVNQLSGGHSTVITSNSQGIELKNMELIPVLKNWNHQGKEYKYTIIYKN